METTIIPGQPGVLEGSAPSSENGTQQAQATPEWAQELAQVKGQLTAFQTVMEQVVNALPQFQAAPQPQPQAAPQMKSLSEMIFESQLPDPLSATNAEEYNRAVAQKLGATLESHMNALLESRIGAAIAPIQEDYNRRQAEIAQQRHLRSVAESIQKSNPDYAQVPISTIEQALSKISTDYGTFAQLLAPLIKPPARETHPTTAGNKPLSPDPGLASILPAGTTEAQLAQLRDTHRKLQTPGYTEHLMTTPGGMELIIAANAAARTYGW